MMDLILIEIANISVFILGVAFGYCKWTSKL